ncbi:MAG: hypothetical protein V3W41_06665 [Planctomycetota bacterium]
MKAVSVALAVWVLFGSLLAAQSEPSPTKGKTRGLSVADIEALLQVGVSDLDLIKLGDRRGWPSKLRQADLMRLDRVGAQRRLRERLLARLELGSKRGQRLKTLRPYDGRFTNARRQEQRYALLVPQGFEFRSSQGGRRLEIIGSGSADWFSRRSYFLWILDRKTWRPSDALALSKVVADSALARMKRGGLKLSPLEFSYLTDPETRTRYPHYDALGRDPETDRGGVFALALKIPADGDYFAVMGYTSPTKIAGQDESDDPATILSLMLGSLKL